MALDLNPDHLLHAYGYAAIFAAPLVESTGIPFPGETILVAGAVYAAVSGRLSLAGVVAAAAAGAILGDNLGYGIGRAVGSRLLQRFGGWVRLSPERLQLLQRFFARRGAPAIFVARFIIVLRTFGALVAGAAEMRYRKFLLFNALGGAAWATAYGLLGFELGRAYKRFGGTVGWFSVGAGIALLVLAALALVLVRRRLERWALGDDGREHPESA
ncbi:MAG TPA: DedA family protein [Candidatus Saccharimonadales bacterium]|nr:DedA family protein [Candidatus Saccharimonadales bacterium]